VSDSTSLEEPKDPDKDITFSLYSLLANDSQIEEMRQNYLGGNYGYGHAKQALYELIVQKFAKERETYNYYMENPALLEEELIKGEAKARKVAVKVLARIKSVLGFA